jgi:hypothetical protein
VFLLFSSEFLSFHALSTDTKIEVYKTMILPVVLYVRKEQRLRLNVTDERSAPLLHIHKVLGSVLHHPVVDNVTEGFCDFPQSLQENAMIVPHHNHFIPHFSQFMFHNHPPLT